MPTSESEQSEGGEEYVVEAVLAHRVLRGKKQYKLRWQGYRSEDDTWEDEENCDCRALIVQYEKENAKKSKRKTREQSSTGSTSASRTVASDTISTPSKRRRAAARGESSDGDESNETPAPAKRYRSRSPSSKEVGSSVRASRRAGAGKENESEQGDVSSPSKHLRNSSAKKNVDVTASPSKNLRNSPAKKNVDETEGLRDSSPVKLPPSKSVTSELSLSPKKSSTYRIEKEAASDVLGWRVNKNPRELRILFAFGNRERNKFKKADTEYVPVEVIREVPGALQLAFDYLAERALASLEGAEAFVGGVQPT